MNRAIKYLILFGFILIFSQAKSQWSLNSDASWKVTSTYQAGWTKPYFNDASWGNTVSPSPNQGGSSFPIPGVKSMWMNPYSDSIYCRKSFELRSLCVKVSPFSIQCDNEYVLYVNGILVGVGRNNTTPYNIQPYLKIGKNVIALIGWDNGPPYSLFCSGQVDYTSGPVIDLGVDKYVCQGDTTFFTTNHSYPTYKWSTGYTGRSAPVNREGTYYCEATDSNGCKWIDTVQLFEYKHVFVNLGQDTAMCTGDELVLNPGKYAKYEWSTGDTTRQITATFAGLFGVKVTDGNGCSSEDSKDIIVFDRATVNLGDDTTLCKGDTVFISASFPFSSYKWSDGSKDTSLMVTKSGNYGITITNHCGQVSDEMAVHFISEISMKLGEDDYFCFLDKYKLEPEVVGAAKYNWTTGDTGSYILVDEPGVYGVEVNDICGNSGYEEVEIISGINQKHMIPNSFSPNRDGKNETWRTYIRESKGFQITVIDPWGKQVFYSEDPKDTWDGNWNGEPLPIGNYLYKVEFVNCQNQKEISTGLVSIVR